MSQLYNIFVTYGIFPQKVKDCQTCGSLLKTIELPTAVAPVAVSATIPVIVGPVLIHVHVIVPVIADIFVVAILGCGSVPGAILALRIILAVPLLAHLLHYLPVLLADLAVRLLFHDLVIHIQAIFDHLLTGHLAAV